MELKGRFKLYKNGKKWCCAAIVFAGLVLGVNTVKADVAVKSPESTVNVEEVKQPTATTATTETQEMVGQQNNSLVTPVNPAAQNMTEVNGVSITGTPNTFANVNNSVYYYGNDGKLYQNQWYQNWGHKYYFGADGARYTNKLADIDHATYYFDNQGVMATNLFQHRNGKLYYFGVDGQEYKNRFYDNWGHTYYFGLDGARYTNQFYNNWSRTYYFGADGARWDNKFYNNWGHTYYFGSDGARWDNQWMNAWNHWYYFLSDGARATSQMADINGSTYFFNNQGIMQQNYFLNKNGKLYYFGNDGREYKNRFYNNWGHTYYFGADGARYTNQFYNNWGHTYYFGADGARWDNRWMNAWSNNYYFQGDGSLAISKFLGIDGNTYYFDDKGVATSWGKVYYDDSATKQIATGWRTINGNQYYFSDGYEVQPDPDDLWVCNDQLYGQMYTGIQWLDGHCYDFGTDGIAHAQPWNDGWSWPFPSSGEGYFLPGQRFGYSSYPRQNGYHDGLDFGTSDHPGSAVHAVHGGRVLDVNTVRDDNGNPMWWFTTIWDGKYLYVYQEAFSNRDKITVSRNDIVYPGQVIGYRDLEHLHLGINTSPNYGIDLSHSFVPSWNDPSQATGHGEWLDPEAIIRNQG